MPWGSGWRVSTITGVSGGGRNQLAEDAIGMMFIEFVPYAQRKSGREVLQDIREAIGTIPGLKVEIREVMQGPVFGKDINIELRSDEPAALTEATARLKTFMESQPTLRDVEDTRPLPGGGRGAGSESDARHPARPRRTRPAATSATCCAASPISNARSRV